MNRPLLLLLLLIPSAWAQSPETHIVIEAKGLAPEIPLVFSASAESTVTISHRTAEQRIKLQTTRLQGKGVLSLGLAGSDGTLTSVSGNGLKAWAVRQEGDARFLDLTVDDTLSQGAFELTVKSEHRLPGKLDLAHLRPGKAASLTSVITLQFDPRVEGSLADGLTGFVAVAPKEPVRLNSTGGGRIPLQLTWRGAAPREASLERASLSGKLAPDGKSITFTLEAAATASEPEVTLPLLSGNAAVTGLPQVDGLRWRLGGFGSAPVHLLEFARAGQFPFTATFVTPVREDGEWSRIDFSLPGAGAVVPVRIEGLPATLEFAQSGVVPRQAGTAWEGFLPASGRSEIAWRASTEQDDGRLFFTSTAVVDCRAGVGLLRQDHRIEIKVLQGKLDRLALEIAGPGEIVAVEGEGVTAWSVESAEAARKLLLTLDRPVEGSRSLIVRSQTALEALPFTVNGVRLSPVGAVRHSGFLRIASEGAVRLEPVELSGLTQLAPTQFPLPDDSSSRQVFAYRFPSGPHAFSLKVDRVQPEISVSQTTVYRFGETARLVEASIEFEIREAPVREIDLRIPAEYSVGAVEGSELADHVPGTTVENGQRSLRLVFAQGVEGRHLVRIQLEWNGAGMAPNWLLPRLDFPDAKSVTGDLGVAGDPGFRLTAGAVTGLAERPVAQFPKSAKDLQQAFRIRDRAWTATMNVESLPQSIQADVFHLYSLSERRAHASILLNYLVTGSPVSALEIAIPKSAENVAAEGRDVRGWQRDGDVLNVALHQPVLGTYTLLLTWQEALPAENATIHPGAAQPLKVASERGFLQVVSPIQVTTQVAKISPGLLSIDPMELPAELRLLNAAPPLATYQYTARPCDLALQVQWFDRADTAPQLVEFAEVEDRVSPDGDVVTSLSAFVKSRGQSGFRFQLPGGESNRLWSVSVDGVAVNARRDGDWMIVPLPPQSNANVPLEVQLKIGREDEKERTTVRLPVIDAPVLKTSWRILADGKGRIAPLQFPAKLPQLSPPGNGIRWLVTEGFWTLLALAALVFASVLLPRAAPVIALLALALAGQQTWQAWKTRPEAPAALTLSLPALAPQASVSFAVRHLEADEWTFSTSGLWCFAMAGALAVWSRRSRKHTALLAAAAVAAAGILLQPGGAVLFLGAVTIGILVRWLPVWRESISGLRFGRPNPAAAAVPLALAGLFFSTPLNQVRADVPQPWLPEGWSAPEAISETWAIRDKELVATGTLKVTGAPRERFVFLSGSAVLTSFESAALSVTRAELNGLGAVYVATLNDANSTGEAKFSYRLPVPDPVAGFPIASGPAALHEVHASYEKPGWVFESPALMSATTDGHLRLAARLGALMTLKPKGRDPKSEPTVFHLESRQLFVARPGVIDGRHEVSVRPSRGWVKELSFQVPEGLTVGEVEGGITNWRFDAEARKLTVVLDDARAESFALTILTQRTLPDLPADVALEPLRCSGAEGEVGLLAVATGPEIQIEKSSADTLVPVNPDDFPLPKGEAVLHRAFRYGAAAGQITLRAVPVAPEVRVSSEEILSFGEERIVLNAKLAVEITRAGLFQLSFTVPQGYEVESLSGSCVRDWSASADAIRINLNGKTIGPCELSITLSAPTPQAATFPVPRVTLDAVNRQSGQLVVRPAAGIRLTAAQRRNVSELDARAAGAPGQGTLAFRILHQDWALDLNVEKLEPWISGQVLQEVSLREGQTRTAIFSRFKVEQASVRSLRIGLPADAETVRAVGEAVSDLVKLPGDDPTAWELRFRRRMFGDAEIRIEFERRRPETQTSESVVPASFPGVNQLTHHLALRTSGRLEMAPLRLGEGWQAADWTGVPPALRDQGPRTTPAESLRVLPNATPLTVTLRRHELADALRLRVSSGTLRTVLSASGDQVTVVDLTLAVVQRGSLELALPENAALFHIHVNGENANAVHSAKGLRFHVLPNAGGNEAQVQVAYAVKLANSPARHLGLAGPILDVPMENLLWRVFLPDGLRLADHQGGFRLVKAESAGDYDRAAFLSATSSKRSGEAREAEQLLQQANQFLQLGENTVATRIFNNAANRSGLDAASNEDARVQLDNLMTQQAIVGLNSRRQRLLVDNGITADSAPANDAQLARAANSNAVLHSGKTELAPQEMSQLLQAGSGEDQAALRRIATRIVEQQQGTIAAPKSLAILLPEGGRVHEFLRPVQAGEGAQLDLRVELRRDDGTSLARWLVGSLAFLGMVALPIVRRSKATLE
jgi:hypothetical protein